MLAEIVTGEAFSYSTNFHFEYALEPKTHHLEGKNYVGIGVLAKMVDVQGNEVTEHIQDITSEPEIAQKLIHLLNLFKVSPMCLKVFVEDFLVND